MARSSYAKQQKPRPEHEDAFIEAILRSSAWAQQHLGAVILGGAILVLGVTGTFYYRNYQARVAEQAAVRLLELGAALGDLPTSSAVDTLDRFVNRYRDTPAADEARVVLGRVLLEGGQADRALESLLPVLERRPDTPLGYAARRLAAAAEAALGRTETALDLYAELANGAALAFQRREALAERARLLAESGRLGEAAGLYAELAERAEEAGRPAEAVGYRLKAGELRGAARAGDSSASAASSAGVSEADSGPEP